MYYFILTAIFAVYLLYKNDTVRAGYQRALKKLYSLVIFENMVIDASAIQTRCTARYQRDINTALHNTR